MIPLLVPIGLGLIGGYLSQDSEPVKYAAGGKPQNAWMVFNYTDNIYASNEVFKTKKEANDFIKSFRNRFKSQGYYRDNRMNKIPIKEIDLLAIPEDFNPFGNFQQGKMYSDFE